MAKRVNYKGEKRAKEISRQKKQEEKRKRRQERPGDGSGPPVEEMEVSEGEPAPPDVESAEPAKTE